MLFHTRTATAKLDTHARTRAPPLTAVRPHSHGGRCPAPLPLMDGPPGRWPARCCSASESSDSSTSMGLVTEGLAQRWYVSTKRTAVETGGTER